MNTNEHWNAVAAVVVALATAGAVALSLHDLGLRSIWGDEGATLSISSQHGLALFHAIARDGGNLALYYVVEHAVIVVFGVRPSSISPAYLVPS